MQHPLRVATVLALLAACGGSVNVEPSSGGTGAAGGNSNTSASASTGQAAGGASMVTGGGDTSTSTGVGAGGGASMGTGGAGAGTSGSGGAGGGAEICQSFGDPCTSCVAVACPAIYCACSKNAECFALSACLQGCTDEACRQDCRTAHADGISDLYLLSGCGAASCAAECPNSKPVDECATCVIDTCPETYNACLADAECVALGQCLKVCGKLDLTCQQACYGQHGAGTMKLQALLECDVVPCDPVCP